MKPQNTPTLAQRMRAFAERKPEYADELRAKAFDFEAAANAFWLASGIAFSEELIRTWRIAREAYLRVRQHELDIAEWAQVTE